MASPYPKIHPLDPEAETFAHEPDTEPPASLAEPVSPAEAQRRQAWTLAPSMPGLTTIVGAVAAVLFGGAVGFWLGRRTAPKPPRRVRRAAATFESAIELAPVAMRLLANPIVRALALRMLVRQLGRRIAS